MIQRLLIVLLLVFCFSSFRQNSTTVVFEPVDCKEVLDSADVLVNTGEFTIHWKAHKINKERNLSVSKWFQQRTFPEIKCMLESTNRLHNIYGFMYAGLRYSDSLRGKYVAILNDTTAVQYQGADGLKATKMTIGVLLKGMYTQILKDKVNSGKRPVVEAKVASFIKSYSFYPDSYKPISFPYFSIGSDNNGLSHFSIRHTYEIKNKNEQTVTTTSQFVLALDLRINVIAQDSTSYISSFPPMLSSWIDSYGRTLNKLDSITLHLK